MAPVPGAPWTGPSTSEMLRTHTLAHEVITRHDDPCPVFDGSELAYLQTWLDDTSTKNAGAVPANQHSLVGHIIARESQGEILLDENEKAALRQWFAEGKAEERIRAWKLGHSE